MQLMKKIYIDDASEFCDNFRQCHLSSASYRICRKTWKYGSFYFGAFEFEFTSKNKNVNSIGRSTRKNVYHLGNEREKGCSFGELPNQK